MTETFSSIDDLIGNAEPDTEVVELGGGRRVKVRGLTRYEYLLHAKNTNGDPALLERLFLTTCLVEPKLSIAQVEAWQRAATPGVLGVVSDTVRRLSGMDEGAQKSGVPGDGDDRS